MMAALLCGYGECSSQEDAWEYAKEFREIKKGVGFTVNGYESENFVWGLAMTKAQANIVIRAGEKAFRVFKEISGVKDWKEMWGGKKALIMVLKSRRQYKKFLSFYAKRYEGPYLWSGFVDQYSRVQACMQPAPRVMGMMHLRPNDMKGLTFTAAHQIGHLCIQRYKYHNRPIPPWLEEGFATYIEARALKKTNCYCFSGGYGDTAASTDKLTNLQWSKWKEIVAGRAKAKSDKHISKILPMRMNELSVAEIGKAWSIIDFIVKTKKKGSFFRYLTVMKRKWPQAFDPQFSPAKEKAQATALKESIDLTWQQLDDEWRQYVRKSYR
jgi:hypothetical protein